MRRVGLELRRWDDETVVYDSQPGSTHLLDPVSSAVFNHLIGREGSTLEIAEALAADFDANAEEEVLEAVRGALAKLRDAGLIQSSAP